MSSFDWLDKLILGLLLCTVGVTLYFLYIYILQEGWVEPVVTVSVILVITFILYKGGCYLQDRSWVKECKSRGDKY